MVLGIDDKTEIKFILYCVIAIKAQQTSTCTFVVTCFWIGKYLVRFELEIILKRAFTK